MTRSLSPREICADAAAAAQRRPDPIAALGAEGAAAAAWNAVCWPA
jgi:hypothetical protein